MKLHTKLFTVASGVFAAASLIVTPLAAAADEVPDLDVVAFVTDPAAANVLWVGGSGTYNFTANSCTGVSLDEIPPDVSEIAAPCTLPTGSQGSFSSIVCGTGTVTGNPTTIVEGTSDTYTVPYNIVFAMGVGVLTSTNATEAGDSGSGVAVGVVIIIPSGLQAPSVGAPGEGLCTNGFTVIAAVASNV